MTSFLFFFIKNSRLRFLSYPSTKLFFICFSLNDEQSFEDIEKKWYPEVKKYCPDAAIVLLGLKMDLCYEQKSDQTQKVPDVKIQTLCQKIDAKYCACSAKTGENISGTFSDCIEYGIEKKFKKKRKKSITETITGVFGK